MKKLILAFLSTIFFSHAFTSEGVPFENKTYVSSDQIMIMPEGIFCLDQWGFAKQVKSLSHDMNGLFIVDDYVQCPACRLWSEDGNLHKGNCPFAKK